MRCVVRTIILTCAAFVLFIYCAVSHANSKIVAAYDANDEEARRILENAIPSPTASHVNSNNLASSQQYSKTQSISVSVALVLIVSLISVALLITGIIIIAVTLDPSSNPDDDDEDDESDLEPDEPFRQKFSRSPVPSSFDYTILSEL